MSLPRPPRAVLIDLAGVLHEGERPIPGAADALLRLRASGLPLRFLTNTTRTPRDALVARLQAMGIALAPHEVDSAPHATAALLRQRGLRPHYLVHPDLDAEMGPSATAPDVVVLGDAGPRFTYEALDQVFRLLMEGCGLIAMARNRYFRDPSGFHLDLGAFVAALEYASGQQAEIAGKPAPAFFHAALQELGVAPQDAVLIGDDLRDDVGGAQAVGMTGLLVRTGKYRPGDEAAGPIRPDLVADDFAAAVEAILAAG